MSLAEDLNPRHATIGDNNPPTLAEILADKHAEMLAEAGKISDRANSLPAKVADDIALGRFGEVVRDARKLSKKIDKTRTEENEPLLTAQRETNAFFKIFIERLDGIGSALEARATDYQNAKAAEERRVLAEQARKAREEEDRQREIAEAAAAKNKQNTALRHEDRAEEAGARAQRLEVAAQASAADLTRVRTDTGLVATSRTAWNFAIEDASKIPLDSLRPYLGIDVLEKAIRSFVKNTKGTATLEGVRIFQDSKASFR